MVKCIGHKGQIYEVLGFLLKFLSPLDLSHQIYAINSILKGESENESWFC